MALIKPYHINPPRTIAPNQAAKGIKSLFILVHISDDPKP